MKVACTLLPYIDFRYGVLPLAGGRAHNRIAPRSEILSATARAALHPSRLKDEPRQGFISVQIFERGRPLFGYRFSSGDEGLFCDTIFPEKPLYSIARKRRAMTGFYKSTIF